LNFTIKKTEEHRNETEAGCGDAKCLNCFIIGPYVMNTYRRSRSIAALILNLSTTWR
jgi:hypothetical protein